jgi:acyl carrier protein
MTNGKKLMNSESGRRAFVELLETSGADALAVQPEREAFIAGTGDLGLEVLEMDSLAQIELVVVLENKYGVELPSPSISNLGTLSNLWSQVLGGSSVSQHSGD